MIGENIKLAFGNFYSNKLRTLLSLLGILIGVASVILITTLGESATADVQKDIAMEGMDLISVQQGWAENPLPDIYAPVVGKQAAEGIPEILRVTPVYEVDGKVSSAYKKAEMGIRVVRPDYLEMNRLTPVAGTLFPPEDEYFEEDQVILGYEAAKSLFPLGHSVGGKIILDHGGGIIRQYEIRGVLAAKGGGMMNSYDNIVFLPYETYSRKVQLIRKVNGWVFQTRTPAEGVAASKKLTSWFRNFGKDQDAFYVLSASSMVNMYKSISKTLKIVLGGIAAISLLVGGIGIMNIMLVSVTERIKEIGIRMSLGATPDNIRSQFLTEAICLTLFGGLLGIGAGAGLGFIAAKIMGWPFTASLKVYLLAAGFSVKIGLFFGFYPAWKASRLDPITALNRE